MSQLSTALSEFVEAPPPPRLRTLGLLAIRQAARLLPRDPVMRVTALVFLVAGFAELLLRDLEGREAIQTAAYTATPLLLLLACSIGLPRRRGRERRFWQLQAVGFGAWTAAYLVHETIDLLQRPPLHGLTVDGLYLAYYMVFLVAVELRPDLGRRYLVGWRFRLPMALAFTVGMYAYLAITPSLLDPRLYSSWFPSLALFLTLDLFLFGRLSVLVVTTPSSQWRIRYLVLAAVWLLFVVGDLVEWLSLGGQLPADTTRAMTGVWYLFGLLTVAVLRLAFLIGTVAPRDRGDASREDGEIVQEGAPILAYALVLPFIHFLVYGFGLFGPLTNLAHLWFAAAWVSGMGGLALWQHYRLLQRSRRLVRTRSQVEGQLRYLASYDPVTGLPNRSLFEERLDQALSHARQQNRSLAVLFIDLNDFKRVNDSLGHTAGDEVLLAVGARLRSSVRDSDTVARFGGDEFTVVLESLEQEADADLLVQRIGAELSRPFHIDEMELVIGASIGVGIFPRDGSDAETLLVNADAAMYDGKTDGGAGVHRIRFFAEERHGTIRDRLQRETELRRAIESGELEVHYQPIWTADGGRVTGVEALVRWRHPQRGLLLPVHFVPLAERIGQIGEIDRWVLGEAAAQLGGWRKKGHPELRLSVNVSSQEFYDPGLPARIEAVRKAHRLAPGFLEIELTESMVVSESGPARGRLNELRRAGVTLAFDDFGTGQSSLQYLTVFLPDRIKIDRSFIARLSREPKFWAVVGGVIDIAQRLDIAVTAEGVEDAEVRARLAIQGCQELQGFLLAPPLRAEEIEQLLSGEWARGESASAMEPVPTDRES